MLDADPAHSTLKPASRSAAPPAARASPGAKARAWRWIAVVIAVAVAAVAIARVAIPPRVLVAAARRAEVVERIVANGRVMPPARVSLGATITGVVARVNAEEGARVKAGELLVAVDDAEARATAAQAKGALLQAQARLEQVRGVTSRVSAESLRQAETSLALAERRLARDEALAGTGSISPAEVDDARHDVEVARSQRDAAQLQAEATTARGADARVAAAAVLQARAASDAAEARLRQTRIVAPADGLVLSRSVEAGDVVTPGRALLVVAIDGPTRITTSLDERDLAALRLGQRARVSADAFPDRAFDAELSYIAPSIDAARGSVEVRLRVASPPEYLRTDMTVSVDLEVGRKGGAIVVPSAAVRDAATRPWVLVVDGGRASRRDVRLGLRGDGVLEIAEGLDAGEEVIARDADAIAPGARVRAVAAPPEG